MEKNYDSNFYNTSSKDTVFQSHNKIDSLLEHLNHLLDEGLSDIKAGRVVPTEIVNKRLHDKYGI